VQEKAVGERNWVKDEQVYMEWALKKKNNKRRVQEYVKKHR